MAGDDDGVRRKLTTRWEPHTHDFVMLAATRAGVSFNEYVTTAALARATMDFVRDYPDAAERLGAVYGAAGVTLAESAEQLLEEQDPLSE